MTYCYYHLSRGHLFDVSIWISEVECFIYGQVLTFASHSIEGDRYDDHEQHFQQPTHCLHPSEILWHGQLNSLKIRGL